MLSYLRKIVHDLRCYEKITLPDGFTHSSKHHGISVRSRLLKHGIPMSPPTSSEFNSKHKRRNGYSFAGHVIPVCSQAPGADIREEDEGQRAAMISGRREGTTPPRLGY